MLVRSSRLRQAEVDLEKQRFRADEAVKAMRAARVQAEAAARELHDRTSNYQDSLVRKEARVHTKTGHTLEGMIIGKYEDVLVLRHAHFIDPTNEGNIVPLDGEQVISLAEIEWLQHLPS